MNSLVFFISIDLFYFARVHFINMWVNNCFNLVFSFTNFLPRPKSNIRPTCYLLIGQVAVIQTKENIPGLDDMGKYLV